MRRMALVSWHWSAGGVAGVKSSLFSIPKCNTIHVILEEAEFLLKVLLPFLLLLLLLLLLR